MNLNVETRIKLDKFVPRWYQLPICNALEKGGYKKLLIVMPRRAGKDVVCFNLLIRAALRNVGVYYYIFPTYSQARKVIWDSITNSGEKFLDYIPKELVAGTNSQEQKITMTNGSIIQLIGSDNTDSLVGSNPKGLIFSEYALQDPRAYQYLRPILAANNGFAIFISTPRGKNHMWEMYQVAQLSPDWFCYKLTIEDTQHIPLAELEKDRQDGIISEDLIQQEYYCFPGSQEVLALNELKAISDIKINEMVISHSGRPRKVLDTIKREYEGEMIKIHSYGSPEPLICTPCHPIRVYNKAIQTYSWKNAGDITDKDRLVFPKMPLGKIQLISYELCMLIAWYVCEGSSFKNGVQFTVGGAKEVDRVTSLICKLNVEYSLFVSETGSSTNVVVYNVQLVDFFKSLCGTESNNKRIPFSWIATHEVEFFHELMWGDGCHSIFKNYEKFSYTTTSKTLAYQVQILANSLNVGYAAGISNRKGSAVTFPHGKTYDCQDSYVVNIGMKGLREKSGPLTRAKYGVAARITKIEREHFKGSVYNIKVQYDESYVVLGRTVHNCSFEMGVEGSYYAKYMDKLRLSGQIGVVPWEPAFKVFTCWDIGVRDSTTIIYYQVVGMTVRIINCYEKQKEGLEHYVREVFSHPYQYSKHFGPHDLAVREFSSGQTRIEKARQLGLTFTVVKNIGIQDGIESVRSMFAKVWIDEQKCKPLIKALENYRQEYDPKKRIYNSRPLHDWSSHFADAMRYLAVSLPRTSDGMSAEDLDKMYNEAMYGTNSKLPEVFNNPW